MCIRDRLEAHFHPVMLFVNNSDKPGFIGALGTMLAEAGVLSLIHISEPTRPY